MSHVTSQRLSTIGILGAMLALSGGAHAGPELTKKAVLGVVRDAMPDVLTCGADIPGESVTVRWVINPEGGVRKVRVDGTHAKDAVGACMKRKIVALRFGPSVKSTPVTFPFRFGASVDQQAGGTKSDGKLSKRDLDGLLQILEGDLKNCGEGVVRTRFTIKETGHVRDVSVTDTDATTEACVVRKIGRVRFPATARARQIEREFSLQEG